MKRKHAVITLSLIIIVSVFFSFQSAHGFRNYRIFQFWNEYTGINRDETEISYGSASDYWTKNRSEILTLLREEPFFEIDNTSSFGALNMMNLHVIKARALPEIPHVYFQFYIDGLNAQNFFQQEHINNQTNYRLYQINVQYSPEYIDFYEVLNLLNMGADGEPAENLDLQYGPPDVLQPHYAVWYEVYEDPDISTGETLRYEDFLVDDNRNGSFTQPVRIILTRDNEQGHSYITVKYIHMEKWYYAMQSLGIEDELRERYQIHTRSEELNQRF